MRRPITPVILILLAWFFSTPAVASPPLFSSPTSEATLLETIRQSPSPLLYAQLARLRAEKAALLYRQWETRKDPSDLREALVYADSASALAPEWDRPWALLGMIHAQLRPDQKALEMATEALIRAVEINPANGPSQLLLAQVLMDQGRFWSAIEQYKSLFAKSAAMVTGINTAPLALCYILDGRVQAGIDYFDSLAGAYPRNAAVSLSKAVLYKQAGRKQEAMQILTAVVRSSDTGMPMRKHAEALIVAWKGG